MTTTRQFLHRALSTIGPATLVLALICCTPRVEAADASIRKTFNIAAGNATVSLKQFAQQSGLELLYSSSEIEGAQTKAVKGRFSSREALAKMLEGTELVATQGENSGALAVTRAPDPNGQRAARRTARDRPGNQENLSSSDVPNQTMKQKNPIALFFAWLALAAPSIQTTQAADEPANVPEDVLTLSVFRVSSTQDTGYSTSNSGAAFRTNQKIMDIPQAIQVVTRDMIEDVGATNTSEILIYAGAVPKFSGGEGFNLRGNGVGYALIDGAIERSAYMDNLYVDSYEIIRGPAAVFYPNSSLGGVVNKNSRKPLPYTLNSVRFNVTDYGLFRAEVDSTGPVGNLGEAKFSYRMLAAYQDGDAYFNNIENKRIVFHPSLKLDYKSTTLLLAVDYNQLTRPSNGSAVLTPDGKLFTGNGRRDINLPPGAEETFTHKGLRFQLIHTFSPDWEMRVGADVNTFFRRGSIVLPIDGVNYITRTITFFNRRNDQELLHYSLAVDVNGKYALAGLKNQSTFGMVLAAQEDVSKFWVNTDFGPGARITRPLDNPSIDTLPVKPADQYVSPANPGSRGRANFGTFFYQHSLDVIPDRLSLVGGVSLYSNETTNITNLSLRPRTAVVTKSLVDLHRYGVVFHVNKDIALYALDANTSLPPSTFRLIDGSTVPPAIGSGREVGVKVSFLDGKISATAAVFDMKVTGQTQAGGVLPSGDSYVVLIGATTQKGYDFDVSFRATDNWQLIGNFYSGDVKSPTGSQVNNSYRGSWSLFTRYDFSNRKLAVGGGAYRVSGRVASSGGITFPVGQTNTGQIEIDAQVLANAFADYKFNKNLSLRIAVDNILDKAFPLGVDAAFLVDPSPPRTISLSAKYRF